MYSPSPTHPIPTAPPRVTDLGRLLLGLAIDRWWPALLVAAGDFTLAARPPSVIRGTILTAVGTLLLLFTTDVLHGNAWAYLWPSAVILTGVVIVARWSGRTLPRATADEAVVRSTAIFGGPKLVSTARHFQGAWLTAIFGGITLDLRDAVPAPGGATVNATVAFGGIDLLVPRGWRISVRSTSIFGGLEDKTDYTAAPPDDAPVLHVDAVCVFGGVEIKHQK